MVGLWVVWALRWGQGTSSSEGPHPTPHKPRSVAPGWALLCPQPLLLGETCPLLSGSQALKAPTNKGQIWGRSAPTSRRPCPRPPSPQLLATVDFCQRSVVEEHMSHKAQKGSGREKQVLPR